MPSLWSEDTHRGGKPMINVGCCGFPIAQRNYYRQFKAVEIQKTFYQPPKLEAARRWREEAPEDFDFTLKAWQLITHPSQSPTYRRAKVEISLSKRENYGYFRPTDEVFAAWEETRRIAQALRATLVVFQCPASFRPTPESMRNMEKFFTKAKRGGLLFGWEPRGVWKGEEIKGLCRSLDLLHIVDPFKSQVAYGSINYFRLHGREGYRYRYSEEELWQLKGWAEERPTWVMFNNVYMLEDSLRFSQLLGE